MAKWRTSAMDVSCRYVILRGLCMGRDLARTQQRRYGHWITKIGTGSENHDNKRYINFNTDPEGTTNEQKLGPPRWALNKRQDDRLVLLCTRHHFGVPCVEILYLNLRTNWAHLSYLVEQRPERTERFTIAVGRKCIVLCPMLIFLATQFHIWHDLQVILNKSSLSQRQKIYRSRLQKYTVAPTGRARAGSHTV